MAKERLKSPRVRSFVAMDLPERIRDGLVDWQRAELGDPALRPVGPQNLHITLAFLGYIPEKAVGRVAEILYATEAEAPEIELQPEAVGRPPSRPRILALDAVSEATVALQAELERALVAERLYEPEKRPFWSHLTVARVRAERRGSKRPARIERLPGPLPEELCAPFFSVGLALYRSQLRPQGAEYTLLAQKELPATGQR